MLDWGWKVKVGVIGLRSLQMEGGIESFCNYVYPELIDQEHDVTFYTRKKYDGKNTWMGQKVVSLASLNFKGLETLSYSLFAVLRALTIDRIDVIHFQGIGPCLFSPLVRLAGKGILVRHVGADWNRPKWGWIGTTTLKASERFAARWAHVVVCLNIEQAREFKDRRNPRGSVVVIPNAVPRNAPSEHLEALSDHGIESGRYILSVSRISQEKGILELMKAYEDADLNKQGFKLAIAGSMNGRGEFKQRVLRHSREIPGVVLLGEVPRSDLSSLYTGAAIFVNASTHEGMSFSALEALSYGCECLFSNIPSNQLGIDSIRWFESGNTASLSIEMSKALQDGRMTKELRTNQRKQFYANYDIAKTAIQTREAIDLARNKSRTFKSDRRSRDVSKS